MRIHSRTSASLLVLPVLVSLAGLILAPPVSAEVGEEWVALYDEIGGHDSGRALVIDSGGNVIVTGSSLGYVPGWSYTYEYATLKYDASGNLLWDARYNGPGYSFNDEPVGVGVDAADAVYVSGSSPGDGTDLDIATVKYDSSGNELWVRRWNGPANRTDGAAAMCVDAAGNVYVTGGSYSPDTVTDMITLKYDSDGNLLWSATYSGGYGTDSASDIALAPDGGVIVTGQSIRSSGLYDWATLKYDTDGNELWVSFVDGSVHSHDYAKAVAVNAAGEAVVTGYTVGAGNNYVLTTVTYDADGDELWSSFSHPGEVGGCMTLDDEGNIVVGCWSGLVLSYDSSGTERWTYDYGAEGGWGRAQALVADSAGNSYLSGYSFLGGEDILTVKLDPEGAELWSITYAGPAGDDSARDIALAPDGDVLVTGASDQGPGRNNDCCTIRYDQTTVGVPADFGSPAARLLAPAPNPFASQTVIRFEVAQSTPLRLEVFDSAGRRVRVLEEGAREAGAHMLAWDGRDAGGRRLAAGIYLVRLESGKTRLSRKVLLMK